MRHRGANTLGCHPACLARRPTHLPSSRKVSIGRTQTLQSAEPPALHLAEMPAPQLYPRFAEKLLVEALEDTPIVLIHGARQSGKTTLAKKLS